MTNIKVVEFSNGKFGVSGRNKKGETEYLNMEFLKFFTVLFFSINIFWYKKEELSFIKYCFTSKKHANKWCKRMKKRYELKKELEKVTVVG